jgi:hypothetical protein
LEIKKREFLKRLLGEVKLVLIVRTEDDDVLIAVYVAIELDDAMDKDPLIKKLF